MKYSFSEYSSSNNPDKSEHFYNKNKDIKPAKSQGIPNYSTSSGSPAGPVHKPLVSSFYSDIMGTSFTPFPSNTNVPNKPYKPISSMQDNSGPLNNVPNPSTTLPNTPGSQTLPRQTMPGTTSPLNPTRPNVTIPAIPNFTSPNTATMPLRPGTVVPTVPTTPGNLSTTPFRPGTMTAPLTNGTAPNGRPFIPTTPTFTTIPGTPGNNSTRPTTPGITLPTAPATIAPTMPGITLPGTTPGNMTMPRSTMPGMTTPTPTMPGMTTPTPTMPGMTTPTPTMPGMTTPTPTMPGTLPIPGALPGTIPPLTTTMPGMTMPSAKLGKHPRTQNFNPNTVGSSKVDYDPGELGGFGPNGIYMTNIAPYHVPLGVPMMPLYGYDNSEDADKDLDYIRQMYPVTAKKILAEISEECDKLEYDGSCMFDEYPDRVYLGRIVDKIYSKCIPIVENSVSGESLSSVERNASEEIYLQSPQKDSISKENYVYYNDRNWLRDMIEVLLFNEMLNRRRRYRSRKRWF